MFFPLHENNTEWEVPLAAALVFIVTDTGRKMAASFLLLFIVGALFVSSNAQENGDSYKQLPETFKKGVDLALENLHSHAAIQHHFLFFRSLTKSDIEVVSSIFGECFWESVLVFSGIYCD